MANPLFDILNGQAQQAPVQQNYNPLLARASQLAQSLPQNFNPQAIVQGMLSNGQVTQQQLDQAIQIANQLTGRR
jgi:protein-disulfide isomerase